MSNGVAVLIPTRPPVSQTADDPRSVADVNFASAVGTPEIRFVDADAPYVFDVVPERVPPPVVPGSTSTNDDNGLPPSVSASDARSAYGTLTRSARACSRSPTRSTRTPSHRSAVDLKTSSGSPSDDADPSSAEYWPSDMTVTFWVSCHSGSPPVSSA